MWDSRVAWPILERLGRLDCGSNPRYPTTILHVNRNFNEYFINQPDVGKAMAAKKVRLFANVREKAGTSEVEVNGDTVSEILDEIIAKYPNLEELIFEDGKKLRGYISILINGENIQHIEGTDSAITDKDEVAIFPPVSGG